MIDISFIRNNPEALINSMKKRGIDFDCKIILDLDAKYRFTITDSQSLQSRRNEISKLMQNIVHNTNDAKSLIHEAKEINQRISELETLANSMSEELHKILSMIPNILDEDVPYGTNEDDNVEIRLYGTIKNFISSPKSHEKLGEDLRVFNFNQASKMSGSRFVVMYDQIAKLERALKNFMIDTHTTEFGYRECSVPYLVNEKAMFGTGQLPKFENGFQTIDGFYLIPTSEVPLVNTVMDTILQESDLPIRLVGYSQCFRSEAGAAGKDTGGIIRQHQFSKVELVSITKPEDSKKEHERMLSAAERILQYLELPYRIMLLCSGDIGFASQKTYDIEVWLPSQNKYREISSCSNTGSFQTQRMKTRFKNLEKKKNEYPHTLNGSALAIGRTIAAIMENYQNESGGISVPKKLIPYMNGLTVID